MAQQEEGRQLAELIEFSGPLDKRHWRSPMS